MGLSSSTSKTEPWKPAQQPILDANSAVAGTYNANAGKIQNYADTIGGLIPGMVDQFKAGNPAVNASQNWITQTLGQTGENPNLQGMIDQTGLDTARGINASIGTRGLTGGSVQQHILSSELAKQALGLRYNDYNNQNQLKAQAAGMAPGVAAANYLSISPLLAAAGSASGLPMDAASQYAGATGGLLGQYTTTKTSQPWGPALLGGIANGLGSYFGQKGG